MSYMYTYKIIKEDFYTREQAKRTRKIDRYEPLNVGHLYANLGFGYKGFYRVLELVSKEELDD